MKFTIKIGANETQYLVRTIVSILYTLKT